MAHKLEYRINGHTVEDTGRQIAGLSVYQTVHEEPEGIDGSVASVLLYFVEEGSKTIVGAIAVDAYMRANANAKTPVLLQVSNMAT